MGSLDLTVYRVSSTAAVIKLKDGCFNDVIKRVNASTDSLLSELKAFFIDEYDGQSEAPSALKLLCGTERGRALRDIIIHQTNVKMRYYEYKENSEKEHLFIEINGMAPLDIDVFVEHFTQDVIRILEKTNVTCKLKLNE